MGTQSVFFKELLKAAELRSLNRGEHIYRAGEAPRGIYLVLSGLVGLLAISSKGHEHLLRLFHQGQFFGHRSMIAEESYHANSVCIDETEIGFVAKAKVEEFFSAEPQQLRTIARAMARELRLAELRRVSIADDDVISRVASSIVVLKELHPEHRWTRTEIANFCASTTPTVIRALGELERRGLIRQESRDLEILDRQGLVAMAV